MTIQNYIPLAVVVGVGAALTAAVPGPFYSADQIKVYLLDNTSFPLELPLSPTTDYVLTTSAIAGSSPAMMTGSITTIGLVTAAMKIAILINPLDEQTSDLTERPFLASDYERLFDLAAMRDARQDEFIKRSPRFSYDYTGPQPVFDILTDGRAPIWDAVRSRFMNGPNAADIAAAQTNATTAANAALSAAASAAAAAASAQYTNGNWIVNGPFVGTGAAQNYPLTIDPGSAANMFVDVSGGFQMVTGGAYSLAYVAGVPNININVTTGVVFEVRTGRAAIVNTPADLSVTTAKIADKAATYAKIQDVSTTARVMMRKSASAGPMEEGSPADLRDVMFPSGSVVDSAYAETVTFQTITTIIPSDDTIPQIGEGDLVLSVSLTPKKITNKIRIHVELWGASSVAMNIVAALFVNGGANAIDAVQMGSAPDIKGLSFSFQYVPGALAAQALTLRVGASVAGSVYLNGTGSGRKFGGASRCTIEAVEIAG